MSEDFWVEVEEAYNQAAELPPNARTTFLKKVYSDRDDIRREVESLLEHQEVAQQFRQSTVIMTAAEMFGEAEEDLIGKTIADKYLVREFLGAGGMAEVYLAEHIALEMCFALKRPRPVLRLDPEYHKRFLEEARRAVVLKHENVARVHDVIDADDDIFVVMEYIEGVTLESHLRDLARPVTIDEFLPIALQCGSALMAAHEKRIAHLDVKPANIMLTPTGTVKICDFGVARRLSSETTTTTTALSNSRWALAGTPAYMAPEVILGSQFDERADLFSLGTVFYEMLTGRNPFRADTAIATTAKVVSHNPEPISVSRPGFDPRLERIVTRLMAKDPDQRYASAAEFIEDLTSLRRARDRFKDLSRTFREAFSESRWMKVAVAVLLLMIVSAPFAVIYRADIQQALGLAPVKVEKNLVPLRARVFVGRGENTQAFADGFTEAVTSRLAQLMQGSEWTVASTALVREHGVETAEGAHNALAADLVLEPTLEVVGDDVRANLNLIDMATNKLHSRTVEGQKSDPFELQDRVVTQLVAMLGIELNTRKNVAVADHQKAPLKAEEYYLIGSGFLREYDKPANIESAIDFFKRAINEFPRFAKAYAGLGQAYWYKFRAEFDKTQLDAASSACGQSALYDPKLPEANICLGNIYISKGEYEPALGQFQKARTGGPSFEVLTGLAEAYEGLENYKLAEDHFDLAVQQNPFNYLAYARLGSYYSRRSRFQEAEDLWRQVVKRSPDNPRALSNLGGILYRLDKFQEAVTVLEKSITLRESLAAYSNLGMTYWRMGKHDKAIEKFQAALNIRDDYRVAGNLARAYYFMPGTRADGLEMYKHAIQLGNEELDVNRRNADVHILLARYHAMLSQKEPALEHLEEALRWDGRNWHYLEIAAIVHNRFNDSDMALKYLEKALSRGFTTLEMRSEAEFSNLQKLPKFQTLLQTNPRRP